jgi:hypothetical protein
MKAYATAPDGRRYEVVAVARGDVLGEGPDGGIFTWVTTLFGLFGLIGWVTNRAAFGGRWEIRVRPYVDSPRGPVTGAVHGSWEMSKAEAFDVVEEMARRIRRGGFESAAGWLTAALASRRAELS